MWRGCSPVSFQPYSTWENQHPGFGSLLVKRAPSDQPTYSRTLQKPLGASASFPAWLGSAAWPTSPSCPQGAAVCTPGVSPHGVDHTADSGIQRPVLPLCLLSACRNSGEGNGGQCAAAKWGEGGGAREQSHSSAGKGSAAAGHIEQKWQ